VRAEHPGQQAAQAAGMVVILIAVAGPGGVIMTVGVVPGCGLRGVPVMFAASLSIVVLFWRCGGAVTPGVSVG
jgi:hypothetical protein